MYSKKGFVVLFICVVSVLLCGCNESYVVPNKGANMSLFTQQGLIYTAGDGQEGPDGNGGETPLVKMEPMADFPVNLALARIQSPGYRSYSASSYGNGKYSVVTVRDIEKPEDVTRISQLPDLDEVVRLSSILLPEKLESDVELRQAAVRLQAGMLLIYTVDTEFRRTDTDTFVTVFTLGLWNTIDIRVSTTVSAVLMDSQSGYIYGVIEETEQETNLEASINARDKIDEFRLKTERKAFESMLDEFTKMWPTVVSTYRE